MRRSSAPLPNRCPEDCTGLPTHTSKSWELWVDTGGTFTDVLGRDPSGRIHRAKVLSTGVLRGRVMAGSRPARLVVETSWTLPPSFLRGFRLRTLGDSHETGVADYDPEASTIDLIVPLGRAPVAGTTFEVTSSEDAAVLAARLLTRTPLGSPLPVETMRLATTLGTNALLERRGVVTALFITRGFGDILHIGTQQRPDLFSLEIRRPELLYRDVVEVPERLDADGKVLEPVDLDRVAETASALVARGVRAAAIALMHSYRNPAHELLLEDLLRRAGFLHVSRSSDLAPFIKLVPRAETAVVDAYLGPVIGEYLERVRASLSGGRLLVMTSAGGLTAAASYRPKDSLLSGPAGGVVGAAAAGRRSGFSRLIAFDMGGTSTDVARFDGDFEYAYEHQVGAAHLLAPALAIESVAAGGGSICWFDGDRLRVGPKSASASPGPACYGAGGPLTLTDVNLLLGRLDPERFEIPIDRAASRAALDAVTGSIAQGVNEPEVWELLQGFLDIANERMGDAIRDISVRRGYDPVDFTLVAFGGAGGQHACAVAARLGIDRVVVPVDAGLMSAMGLGHAAIERFAERQVLAPLDEVEEKIPRWMDELAHEAVSALATEQVRTSDVAVRRRRVHLRLQGQESTIEVEWDGRFPLARTFEERYLALYGHAPEARTIEVESLRVVASAAREVAACDAAPPAEAPGSTPRTTVSAFFDGRHTPTPTYAREELPPGARLFGPAIVFERHGATVVEPGWRADVDGASALVLSRDRGHRQSPVKSDLQALRLELFTNRFRAIAREMGERLRRTAISTNIKERLDFSCALLDEGGRLVVNAPHIPVHLGAIGLCVQRLRETIEMAPGDVVVTNHPAFGGSHLPDVTVVSPAYLESEPPLLLGYVASRAHHAELGGSRPGSMPPAASRLFEEGIVIPPIHLVRGGVARWEEMTRRLGEGPFPSRAIEDNIADMRAAIAANHCGVVALGSLAKEHGADVVRDSMRALQDLAARRMEEALLAVADGSYEATERLDDGSPLRVRIVVRGGRAVFDFEGSSDVHPGNLNATPAIVRSAVIYVLRLLLHGSLPLNDGLMRPVELIVPPGILDPEFPEDPRFAPAVVGGNVETSQRLVDTMLKALSMAACSQGTMNNVLFGNSRFSYYETVCGGSGAGSGFDGASAVHTHMTNTRITDPEVLEHRYPVRVERFGIRRGSGGAGRFRGGDGAVRELRFLEPMSLSILSQHRTTRPYGLEGGEPGSAGAQKVVRAKGEVLDLRPIDSCDILPGDRLILETPGGGGWGRKVE